ncbi:MAG: hypothetical protein WAV56_02720 [Microgenomates group bacterium]
MEVTRHPNNPILKPDPTHSWENYAVFNGCPIKVGNTYYLLYRAMGDELEINGKRLRLSVIAIADSPDGVNFTNRREFIKPQEEWERFGCEDPRVTFLDGNFYIFYTALADWPPAPEKVRTAVAISPDLITISERKLVTPFNSKAMTLFPEKVNGKYQVVLSVDPDTQQSLTGIAAFDRLEDLANQDFWHDWYKNRDQHQLPLKRMYHDQVEVGAPPLKLGQDWLFIYSYIKNRWIGKSEFRIEAVLLDHQDPRRYLARLEKPLLEPMVNYESEGQVQAVVFPAGALIEDEQLKVYYGAADSTVDIISAQIEQLKRELRHHAHPLPRLIRASETPIIKPNPDHPWEAKATFNPAAFDDGTKIHLVYRAMSFDNTSVLGHADSEDGITINSRDPEAIYLPRTEAEQKKKPFANSGVEDPRITKIGDTIYLCYTAYDGVNPPRVAFTSISAADFENHRWNWKEPVLISKPGIDDKDACILPEKLDDRYVIFHRIGRNIVFDYTDSLDLDGQTFFEGTHQILVREKLWDGERIGICAPPIKTKDGWLLFYHGRSAADHEYRVGAMLLYPKHPSIVIARTPYPLLEPELMSERFGHVNNVVFPCGVVLQNDTLFVYYGGGDQVCAVATIALSRLLGYLEEIRNPAALG